MKFYSANEVSLNVGGLDIGAGKAADMWLEIEPVGPRFLTQDGIDGEVTLSENKANTHKVMVHLQQSSDDNDKLSAIMKIAEVSQAGAVVPLAIKDNQGTSLLASLDAVIEGWPTQPFGKESGEIVWTFLVANPQRFVGGNSGT